MGVEQTKDCPVCGETFHRHQDYSTVQWVSCRYCSKQCAEEQKRRVRAAQLRCKRCHSAGPFHQYKTSSGRLSRRNLCIVCSNEARRPKRKTDDQRKRQSEYSRQFRLRVKTNEPHRLVHSKAWAERNPERYLYFRMNANSRKHRDRMARRMTFEEFVKEIGGAVPKVCPILGIPLCFTAPAKSDCIPTVDRFDSLRPYEVGNVAIISWRANIIKNMGTADEHRRIADWMDNTISARRQQAA